MIYNNLFDENERKKVINFFKGNQVKETKLRKPS